MTLRARLALGLVVLAAFGLTVAGVVTYRTLRSYLYDRVDEQLSTEIERVTRPVGQPLPLGGFGEVRTRSGALVVRHFFPGTPRPALPDAPERGYLTVDAADGSTRFRVLVEPTRLGGTQLLALPLDDVERTLDRLLVTELVVAGVVLVLLAGAGWWLVHLGLRPLERMGETAGAIAAGDLSRRVDPADERTEVGRLGIALNAMLGQIEEAFAEREQSEARLRQFVADASHELRTPLTSIRGYSELFRRGAHDRPEDLAKAMRRIEEEASRMGVLVDDLLLLARLDQGRPLAQEPVALSRLAQDAVDDARAIAPDRPIELVPGDGAVVVPGDEARLRQVLANLLGNACAHTPPGTPVRVHVGRSDGEAVVEVSDAGPGMAAEDAARAFERFWRADASRARASGGAGLGLAIVDAIATAHGGRAEIETAPGAGTTVRVHLPAPPA